VKLNLTHWQHQAPVNHGRYSHTDGQTHRQTETDRQRLQRNRHWTHY